jgi:hypothetical protein
MADNKIIVATRYIQGMKFFQPHTLSFFIKIISQPLFAQSKLFFSQKMGFGASKPKVPSPPPADAKSITPPPESISDDFKLPISTESLEVMSNGPNAPHYPKPQYPPHSPIPPKTQKIAPHTSPKSPPSCSRPHPGPSTASTLTKALNPHKHTQKNRKIFIKNIFLILILQNRIILMRMMTGLKGN